MIILTTDIETTIEVPVKYKGELFKRITNIYDKHRTTHWVNVVHSELYLSVGSKMEKELEGAYQKEAQRINFTFKPL